MLEALMPRLVNGFVVANIITNYIIVNLSDSLNRLVNV